MNKAKPFLKWAGGKGQLLEAFQSLYPTELKEDKITYFYEPFVGSGAVFFNIMQQYKIEKAFLYDINPELILAYRVIQKEVAKLIELLTQLEKSYLRLSKEKRKAFYYQQRELYNFYGRKFNFARFSLKSIQRTARLIFLNRTCYNGLFRVNSKGDFNVPAGDYKNPTICDEQNLLAVSKVLQNVEIKKAVFNQVIDAYQHPGFVYFDPPYRPISKTSGFTSYSKFNFTDEDQVQLAEVFRKLDERGAKLMLSNSDPKNIDPNDCFFDDLYSDYQIKRIPAKRAINSNPAKRGVINEIVVMNYSIVDEPQ